MRAVRAREPTQDLRYQSLAASGVIRTKEVENKTQNVGPYKICTQGSTNVDCGVLGCDMQLCWWLLTLRGNAALRDIHGASTQKIANSHKQVKNPEATPPFYCDQNHF